MTKKALDYILRVIKDTMEARKGKIVTTVSKKKLEANTARRSAAERRLMSTYQGERHMSPGGGGREIVHTTKSDLDELEEFIDAIDLPHNAPKILKRRRKTLKKDPDTLQNL